MSIMFTKHNVRDSSVGATLDGQGGRGTQCRMSDSWLLNSGVAYDSTWTF